MGEDLWDGQRGDTRKGECNRHLVRVRHRSTGEESWWGGEGSGQKQMRWKGLSGVALPAPEPHYFWNPEGLVYP